MITEWFYILTLALPGSHTSISASYSGMINVGPKATPKEIFDAARKMVVDEARKTNGVDLSRANTMFWHTEPNTPVGGTSPAPPSE